MTIQEINSQSQTVDLSDIYATSGINLDLVIETDSEIEMGDLVSYVDDNGCPRLGLYQTLWAYEHAGETSPFWGDSRLMALVYPIEGGCSDYADCMTIVKLVDAFPTMKV